MARHLRTLLEIGAAVAAASLLILPTALHRVSPERRLPQARASELAPEPAQAQAAAAAAPLLPPTRIAALFPAPRKPPSAPALPDTPSPPERTLPDAPGEQDGPPPADWLRFVGSATDSLGRRVLFFKNLRTGTLERAASPADEGEWELGAQDEASVEIRNHEEAYRVPLK